ncbi:MAG: sensor histidine kinase [Xanthomonadaceae bacterium]|jgi:two-component system sensor histidine kinase QseC|nr:sensor histidine kinase [Xanthomonadaceae bacterium]
MSSNRPGRWSIRRYLVIGLSLTIGLVLTSLFIVVDYEVDREMYERMDNALLIRAHTIASHLPAAETMVVAQWLPEYARHERAEFFTLYKRGDPVLMSPNSHGIPLRRPPRHSEVALYYNLNLPDGHAGRAIALHQRYPDTHQRYLLVVASERESWDRSERRLHFTIMLAIVLATIIAVAFSYLLLRLAFKPLLREGRRIARLDPNTPHVPNDNDLPQELAPFVQAFNIGISRLYEAIERERHFSRDIAHELRTPLSEIRTTAEVALQQDDPGVIRNGLVTAIASTERMQGVVDTLLMMARYESGQEQPSFDPLDLSASTRDMIGLQRHGAEAKQLEIRLDVPDQSWTRSDEAVLERILSNLLHNAIEYAPEGSRIDCVIENDSDGGWICLENEASELTEADLARMGARFWRKNEQGGTAQHAGLGLALASEFAHALGLRLRFRLRAGRLRVGLGAFPSL